MELLFLTGMSGAGKSAAVRYLEDCGYFCMDNVPPYVLPDLVKSFFRGRNGEGFSTPKLAFVVDIRSQEYLDGFSDAMAQIDSMGIPYKIIFFEASDHVLIARYQETRRKHPLALPVDCDYVFDVRFLPNPFYFPQMRNLTGKDEAIATYLEGFSETAEFNYMTSELLRFVIPYYENKIFFETQIRLLCRDDLENAGRKRHQVHNLPQGYR